MIGRILSATELPDGNVRLVVDCDCPHCSTKDWESVFCVQCAHALAAHSTNGPWCMECDRECHSGTFLPLPARTGSSP